MTTAPPLKLFDSAWYTQTYPDVEELGMDPYEHYTKYGRHLGRSPYPRIRRLERIVFVVPDLSTIGGMSSRTRNVLNEGGSREPDYVALTARSVNGTVRDDEFCYTTHPETVIRHLDNWLSCNTVMVVSNNAIRSFPKNVRERIQQFPIIYICAGQLAFMLQDSTVLAEKSYRDSLYATHIMSFSEGDINFQRQLGVYGQVKGFAPVKQQTTNPYDKDTNTRLGYVGRIDFHAKDSAKLLDIARVIDKIKWGPIKVYTTDGNNSPDYKAFRAMIADSDLEDRFEIILNKSDPHEMYGDLALLLTPSKKESFGNAVAEALSYGVPVIAASYAPGPAEILEHGKSGFLLDDYNGQTVAALLESLNQDNLIKASQLAFARHKTYGIDDHVNQLEDLARDAVDKFPGQNTLRVFPKLKILGD